MCAARSLDAAESEPAIILRGGPIITVDDAVPVAEALAIRGSTIVAVGSATEIKRQYTRETEIVDLEGHAVLPGFVDPHVHVLMSALTAAGAGEDTTQLPPERLAEMCASTLREFASRGCTTVYDAGIGLVGGAAEHELLRTLVHAPGAPVRVRGAFTPELAAELAAIPGAGDERYDVVGIKYWADGSIEDFTAALNEPYLNGHGTGRLNHDEAQLREAMRAWHRAGWQLVVHCNGDRATDQALRIYEALLAEDRSEIGQRPDVRHRIDHFTVGREDQIAKAAALGLSVSHTIDHVHRWGATFRDHVLGPERAARIHALGSDIEHGVCSSCHSDSPASPVNPCMSLHTATTRLMQDSEDVLGPTQQLDLEEALRTVTCNPARQVLLEDRVGSLRPGKLADLVVLDRDPRSVPPERLHELKVLETWLGGRRQRWGAAARGVI
jgi:predicted amidohydrolase YtcJ